jgi:DNA-binding response OmpR family regulator
VFQHRGPRVEVVVVVDRHERGQIMRQVVEQSDVDVTVVGHADGPITAVEVVGRLRPHAVVLEIQLPVAKGLETISAPRDRFPHLAIIVRSFRADATTRAAALTRGANTYLGRPFGLRDLRAALRSSEQIWAGTSWATQFGSDG